MDDRSVAYQLYVGIDIAADTFTFLGFPPRKGPGRAELLEEVAASPRAAVLYESPNRVGKLLADLAEACGPSRRVAVARELTKLHEEFFRGTLAEGAERFGEVFDAVSRDLLHYGEHRDLAHALRAITDLL